MKDTVADDILLIPLEHASVGRGVLTYPTYCSSAPPSPSVLHRKNLQLPPPRPRTTSTSSSVSASSVISPHVLLKEQSAPRVVSPPTPPRQRLVISACSRVSSSQRGNRSSKDSNSFPSTSNISDALAKQQPTATLVKTLQKAIQRNIRKNGKKHHNTVQFRILLGNVYFRQGNLDRAAAAYKLAVEACAAPGEHLSTAYLNLGTVRWRSGEISEAIRCLQQALHEMLDEESMSAASAYHQLGLCYALTSDWTMAVTFLNRALTIRARGSSQVAVGQTMDAIGRVYFMQGRYDEALAFHHHALRLLQTAGVIDIATPLQNIANVHIAASMPQAALAVLKDVYKIQRAAGIESAGKAVLHCQTLLKMAKLYVAIGLHEQSAQLRREADDLSSGVL